MTPKQWTELASKPCGDYRAFRVRQDRLRSPRTGMEQDFFVLEMPDWVNVIAMTAEDRVVMIRQYRFGRRAVGLEIPGGVIDPGETPSAAAERELREETGYVAARWTPLGTIQPNPALANNLAHTYLAEGCVSAGPPQQEEGEDIQVEEHALAAIPALLASGQIAHALVAVAFQKFYLLWAGHSLVGPAV